MRAVHSVLDAALRLQSALTAPLSFAASRIEYSSDWRFIFGQGKLKGRRLYLARAEDTACEVVAVYNAAGSFGLMASYDCVRRAFFARGALTLFPLGFFGGNPYSIGRVLRYFGIKSCAVRHEELDRDGSYILSFWNGAEKLSLHTVFFRVINGTAEAYNLYPSDRAPRRFDPGERRGLIIRCLRLEPPDRNE